MDNVTPFCTALHLACKSLQFYAAEHPRSAEALQSLEQAVIALLAHRSRIAIAATKSTLMADGSPIVPATPAVRALAKDLESRQIGGFVLTQGVSVRELTEFVRVLNMKAQQLSSLGGPEEALRRADVMHVRMSRVRYEAVTEGEEVVWSKSIRHGDDSHDVGAELATALQRYLLGVLNAHGGETGSTDAGAIPSEGEFVPDPVALEQLLGDSLAERIETSGPQPAESAARDVLRSALASVEPALQLALLVSLDKLPPTPTTEPFRAAARALAAEPRDNARIASSSDDAIAALTLALGGGGTPGLDLLRGRVEQLGMSREQLDELVRIIGWDKLSADQKVAKLLEGENALDIPSDKLIAFLRELVATNRHAEVLTILERYAGGFDRDSYTVRESVTDVFAQVADMIDEPGLTPPIEQLLVRMILTRCTKEIDARLHRSVAEAGANVISGFAGSGRSDAALRILSRLQSTVAVAPAESPIQETYRLLITAVGEPRRAQPIVGQIVAADAESLGRSVIPLVVDLGATLAPALIDALATEEDRNRRGRFVKALKAIGKPAFPALLDALTSPAWYVVRNALMVLGDIGVTSHVAAIGRKLQHGDPRVRRAAARALAKIGGPEAERDLAEALSERDQETLGEVLHCLGTMRAESAVPAVIQLAKARLLGGDEKVREIAISTLGQIGSDPAIEFLAELVKPRTMFNRESLPIRSAAAAALAQAPTMTGRQVLQSALAAETDAASKEMLAASLARTQ
jgi:HEAT repeat protein